MTYDSNNIFAKILRGEIPCERVFEDEDVLAFRDIRPKAPVHVLVIPKSQYISFHDFCEKASPPDIGNFFKKAQEIANLLYLNEKGYRLVCNCGPDSGQEVPHFHVHIIGGEHLKSFA
jgi:diadenosine tetraphosphate (Ap4A) HIT family hydrolase